MLALRRITAILLITACSTNAAPCNELERAAPESVGVSTAKCGELSEYMQSLVNDGKIAGGVILMARKGKVVHLRALGMADREGKVPMKEDTIFRIASMTKPITSVAVMMLVEEGKLRLDDPVSKHLPEFKNLQVLASENSTNPRPAATEITIQHLLTHTSGLAYNFDGRVGPVYDERGVVMGFVRTDVDLAENTRRLALCPLLFNPGESWNYGMSTDVLGCVVERVSGMGLDDFLQQRICQPLGMTDTCFCVPLEKRARVAAAYIPVGPTIRKVCDGELLLHESDWVKVWTTSDYCFPGKSAYLSGGSGLCSTASDYLRFCQMMLNKGELNGIRLLREDTVARMTKNQVGLLFAGAEFGLGFAVVPKENRDSHEQLKESYSWGGYWSTSFRVSPRGEWIVISLTQLAFDNDLTLKWADNFDRIAAEAILP